MDANVSSQNLATFYFFSILLLLGGKDFDFCGYEKRHKKSADDALGETAQLLPQEAGSMLLRMRSNDIFNL